MYGLDVLHKFNWIRLIARMFEAMAGNYVHSSDIQLFINVINGSLALHAEDACILRYCMATIVNAAHQFKNIFSHNGYFLIMPSVVRIYSNNQTNELITRTVEFVCKQLYVLHRKPFLLQMFGSVAPLLDGDDVGSGGGSAFGDAFKVQPKYLYKLLCSLSKPGHDLLHMMELVKMKKPLTALDFCYQVRTAGQLLDFMSSPIKVVLSRAIPRTSACSSASPCACWSSPTTPGRSAPARC